MTRILMRGGKSPFNYVSYEDTLAKNTLGTNSGNLIFAESVWRSLSTKDTTLAMNGYSANPKRAAEVNANYDVLVLPFANAFRTSFLAHLRNFTALIEKLDIPVVVTGVGAQAGLDASPEAIAEMGDDVRAFCKAVLKRSASIGVRGEYTYEFIRSLGFSDDEVDIIGCPSMFYYGPEFPKIKKRRKLLKSHKVSMNVSPYVPGIGKIFERNYKYYNSLTYVPQNNESLDQVLWDGKFLPKFGKVFPKTTDHPMFAEDRIRMFIDTKTWLDHLRNYDFVFGTRIHGNVMGLLAGTPSFVLAHDSRTLELARYFEIPHKPMTDITTTVVAHQLYKEADYGPLQKNHKTRFDTWISFLEKNNLRHIYQDGEDKGAAFARDLASAEFPGEMPTLPNQTAEHLQQRLLWQSNNTRGRLSKLEAQMKSLSKTVLGK
ncbi:polysaccharide pyruvyl transferase family protein [Shimia sagamensis]|uniref:Polysaccharide pyruvyl transferase n=1 Tax=Shimia sagamensis TaxID=1566352 RepID=A0ABY1NDQ4_9RHOB|nr:polysaccharide pyruvyl transferase family protein [Shimia sagamensis]SMP06967.1 Polysaccharide pyruvyl transferase [Shimia sagamensis]